MTATATASRVVVVVVAFDRIVLLEECLRAIYAQTCRPVEVVVVDNASTDGSPEMVATRFPQTDLVRCEKNTGGAGGFAVGIARAVAHHSAELVWIMDDDTIPQPDALEKLLRVRSSMLSSPVVLGSRAVWTDGADHPMNTPRRKPFVGRAESEAADAAQAMPIRSTSFVSLLVEAKIVRELGLPIADYFIWNDDFEFSARLLRRARGVFVPASVVVHKTKALASTDVDPGDRFFFEVRNKIWLFRFSQAFSPFDRLIYAMSTIRRWIRTVSRSGDRSTLLRVGRQGLRDGLRSRPRPNVEVLANAGVALDDVRAIDEGVAGSAHDIPL